jgi:hypothetical protein
MAGPVDEQHFVRGVRSSAANNTTAYGFSLTVAGSFAALTKLHGTPTWIELFLFLVGSCAGFAGANALSTRLFKKESPDEPELVISLATSLSMFSVCGSVGAATGVSFALGGWPAWLLAALAFTLAYVIGVGAEIGVAAHRYLLGGSRGRGRERRG